MSAGDARRTAEQAARESYGRLLASLAYRWRDIAAAEDALAEAFARALEYWPRDGVPERPDAWLTTVARSRLLQAARHRRVELDPAVTVLLGENESAAAADPPAIADERLRLMYVCAHPAIDAGIRSALMLQVVLGLDASRIAAAFLVKPATLAQRLVRAKTKIRASGIRFELPEQRELAERGGAVLEAIYAAHALGWHNARGVDDAGAPQSELAGEALYLAGLCSAQRDDDPEALGLHALLLFCEARRGASIGPHGEFVPLLEQDTERWDRALIEAAETRLRHAATFARPGRFQIEAAIQSAHCERAFSGVVPWDGIERIYSALLAIAPSIGARVGHAVAASMARDPRTGLALLARIEHDEVRDYQPYWVALAHMRGRRGDRAGAVAAYDLAIGLTEHAAIRAHLDRARLAQSGGSGEG